MELTKTLVSWRTVALFWQYWISTSFHCLAVYNFEETTARYLVQCTVHSTLYCTVYIHTTQYTGTFYCMWSAQSVIAITDQLRNAHAQPTNCSEGIFHEREIFLIGQETLFWPGNSFIFDLDNKPCLDLEIVFFFIWTIYPVLTWQHCFSQSGQQLKVQLIIKQKF